MVAVTGAFGGGAEVDADPRDGMLDVVVIEAGSRLRLITHAYGMRSGRLEGQTGVLAASRRRVDVETDGRTGFNVDGEVLEATAARISVEPAAFEAVIG
jgi:diacylglycerol kinase (ATP)